MSEDHDAKLLSPPRLDPSLYELNEEQSKFYKQLTKIEDDEELKQHILAVQREAYEVQCIR
jgi:hypothetical protein